MGTERILAEIASQPEAWRRAAALSSTAEGLPSAGERVAVVGCGTSWFIAQAYAALREEAGSGVTDAYTPTEARLQRDYDRIVALSRSGTTPEVVDLLAAAQIPSTLITAVAGGPAEAHASRTVVLDFADEESVVQTRFATSALALLRASVGEDVEVAARGAERALEVTIDPTWIDASQITFLGTGWTIGLAHEAALKVREAAQSWTESYPASEYRHGPIAVAEPGRVVWVIGEPPAGLADDVTGTGAVLVTAPVDPAAHLVLVQRLAVARAEARGLDPEQPRSLTRPGALVEV